MKKLIPFALGILISANLLAHSFSDSSFTISGIFTGFTDSTIITIENANNNEAVATGMIVKGKITLLGKVSEPSLCLIKIAGEQPAFFYIENSQISINIKKEVPIKMAVSGSTSHQEFSNFQTVFNPLALNLQMLSQKINELPEGEARSKILVNYGKTLDSIQQQIDLLINQRPDSYVTPFVLLVTNQFYDDVLLLEKRFKRLSQKIQHSVIGNNLGQYINYNKVGAVGSLAINFTQPDISGKPIALSAFHGKYLLVDFWASWCKPCRLENPNVVANYEKFKSKNFTILGVSLDKTEQKNNWIEAIKADKLSWTQVSDLKGWSNEAAQLYHVSGIPFNLLVDPQGVIIARNLRGFELERKLCEVLGCN